MHQYLKAIGFGNISSKKELREILTDVRDSFTQHDLIAQDTEMDFCEYQKEYGAGMGITICGDIPERVWGRDGYHDMRRYEYP